MLSLLLGLGLRATTFRDATSDLGLTLDTNQACFADFDQDGWPDLCSSGAVWHNNQGRSFTKIAEIGNSVAADYDNDGYPDLFSWSQQALFHNDKGKGFTRVELPGWPNTVSRGACWGDFNNDGFVDLYVGGYEDWDKDITYPSFVLMNKAGKSFEVSWSDLTYRARGVTACDFDRDNDLDVYVSNYRLQPNRLFVNDGFGKFADRAGDYNTVATSPGFEGGHSIGAAWGDFDNDGEFDLFAGNFAHVDDRGDQPKSRFLKNLGKTGGYKFQDLGPCGVFYQESYASPAAADYDNDGNLDLYFTTVYDTASFGKKNYPVLFHNDGNFAFSDATLATGLAEQAPTYQSAWADIDRDGDLDLVTGGKFYINNGNENSWLEVRLVGDGKAVNKSAIGAQVRIKLGGRTLACQVEAGTGEGNQNDLMLHFGLGNYKGKVDLDVTWPNGKKQKVRNLGAAHTFILRYGRKGVASHRYGSMPAGSTVEKRKTLEDGLKNLQVHFNDLDGLQKVTREFDADLYDVGLSAKNLTVRLRTWKGTVESLRMPEPH